VNILLCNLLLNEASLAYIVHFNSSNLKPLSKEALSSFLLLNYAIEFWYNHARVPDNGRIRMRLNPLIGKALETSWDIYRRL
jgi:hypothetical protein